MVTTVTVGDDPVLAGMAITPDGAFAYVANFNSGDVSVIETASNTVVATVPVGGWPVGVAITPDGAFVYVTNEESGNVSVIETATNTEVATFRRGVQPSGVQPKGVAFTPDGVFAYVVIHNGPDHDRRVSHNVSVIETAS